MQNKHNLIGHFRETFVEAACLFIGDVAKQLTAHLNSVIP